MKLLEKNRKFAAPLALFVVVIILLTACGSAQNSPTSNVAAIPTPTLPPPPPENYFPAKMGDFTMTAKPSYVDLESKECRCRYFTAAYKKENLTVSYDVGVFDSEEKAKQAFDAKIPLAYTSEVLKQSGKEMTAIQKIDGKAEALRLKDEYIIKIEGKKEAVVALENSFPYKSFGILQPPARKIEEYAETPVLVSAVQKDFEKNAADAAKKYAGNFVLLKAKIVEVGDNLEKTTIVEKTPTPRSSPRRTPKPGTLRRRSELLDSLTGKTPTPKPTPKTRQVESHHPYIVVEIPSSDGGEPLRVICEFNPSQKDNVLKLKNGDEILFRAMISFPKNALKIGDARLDGNFQ